MMRRLHGKRAGEHLRLHQWANDWISADDSAGRPVIVRPTDVRVDGDEYRRLREDYSRWLSGSRTSGQFWTQWRLDQDGTFHPCAPSGGDR